jgi:Zn-dependent peptidase ImmA (M78 family)
MRKIQRAVKEAHAVLAAANVKRAPVDIYKIARSHAHVLEQQMPDSISGMLIPAQEAGRDKRWTIVANASHAEVRRRFTVAHELGHLLLHDYRTPHADTGFKIRFRANLEYDGSMTEEIEANQFAAEVLMPSEILLARTSSLDIEYVPSGGAQNDEAIESLAREFAVSKQALQIRLSDFI